jgi:hypothetical protein
VAGDDERGVERLHLVEQLDPGGALLRGRGVRHPDVLLLEEEHAADDRAVLGVPQVVAVGQDRGAAAQLEAGALDHYAGAAGAGAAGDIAVGAVVGEGLDLRQARREVRAQRGPRLELALVGGVDVLDDQRGGDDPRVREGSATTSRPK